MSSVPSIVAARAGPMVDDLGRTDRAPLADHHAGAGVGVDGELPDVHALAAQSTDDGRPEPVRAHASYQRDRVAESSKPDRDVRLGAGDVPLE